MNTLSYPVTAQARVVAEEVVDVDSDSHFYLTLTF